MRVPSALLFSVLLSTMTCLHPASASSALVTVTDADGERLEHAVISFHGKTPQIAHDQTVAIMDQQTRQFAPTVLPIQQGTDVSFPNSDDVRHHVYSFSHPNNFELKLYHGERNAPVRFDHPGVVVLGCNIHDGMIGYLQVVDTPWFDKTGTDGLATVDRVPPGDYTLQVWHPDLGMRYERRPVSLTAGHQSFEISLKTGARREPAIQAAKPAPSPLQSLFDD